MTLQQVVLVLYSVYTHNIILVSIRYRVLHLYTVFITTIANKIAPSEQIYIFTNLKIVLIKAAPKIIITLSYTIPTTQSDRLIVGTRVKKFKGQRMLNLTFHQVPGTKSVYNP